MLEKNEATKMISQAESNKIIQSKKNMKDRLFSFTIVTGAFLIFNYLGVYTTQLFYGVCSFFMLGEMNALFKATKTENYISFIIFAVHQILLLFVHEMTFDFMPFVAFITFLIYSLYTHDTVKSIKLFGSYFWSVHLLSHAVGIGYLVGNTMPIINVGFLNCMNDTSQYVVGRFFGKNRPFTWVSPNKSIEGYLGGLFTLIVLALISGESVVYSVVVIFIIGSVGDLIASVIKRQLDIKDFGSILPGMGGMFDRMDSMCVVIACSYYWYKLFGYHPGYLMSCIQHYFFGTNDVCPF